MSNSIMEICSQRLKKVRIFSEHLDTHPVCIESSLKLEREAVYKPLSPELRTVVKEAIRNNPIHMYTDDAFTSLKHDLAHYLNTSGVTAENLFIAQNLYCFYEHLTELFLQKDQKVLLYTADDNEFEQEAKYINSSKVIVEHYKNYVSSLSNVLEELSNDDYKIVVLSFQQIQLAELQNFVDLLPENVVLVLKTQDPIVFKYICHGTKTVLVLKTFPAATTLIEPPLCFTVTRPEVANYLNDLQLPNQIDAITLAIARYYTSFENPVEYNTTPSVRPSEYYEDILLSLIRENVEFLSPKNDIFSRYNVAKNLKTDYWQVLDFANGNHFLGLSEEYKQFLLEFVDSTETFNYYSQRTLLRNMIAQSLSGLNKKFQYSNIVLGAGVTGLLESIAKAFVSDGEGYKKIYKDKVLILDYSSDNYYKVFEKCDAKIEVFKLDNNLDLDLEAFIDKVQHFKPRIVLLDNPRLTVGSYFDREQLEYILANIPEQTIIVIDESYYKYAETENKDFVSAINYLKSLNNLIVLRSFSYTHAFAGLRLGYAIGADNLANLINTARHPFDISPYALYLGIKVLEKQDIFEKVTLKYFHEQKQYFYKELSALGLFYIQSATNSVLVSSQQDCYEIQEKLLPYKILVKPVDKNLIRLSVNDQKNNAYLFNCLKDILNL